MACGHLEPHSASPLTGARPFRCLSVAPHELVSRIDSSFAAIRAPAIGQAVTVRGLRIAPRLGPIRADTSWLGAVPEPHQSASPACHALRYGDQGLDQAVLQHTEAGALLLGRPWRGAGACRVPQCGASSGVDSIEWTASIEEPIDNLHASIGGAAHIMGQPMQWRVPEHRPSPGVRATGGAPAHTAAPRRAGSAVGARRLPRPHPARLVGNRPTSSSPAAKAELEKLD